MLGKTHFGFCLTQNIGKVVQDVWRTQNMAGFTHPWSPVVIAGDRQGQAVGPLGPVTVARPLTAGMPCLARLQCAAGDRREALYSVCFAWSCGSAALGKFLHTHSIKRRSHKAYACLENIRRCIENSILISMASYLSKILKNYFYFGN